ncbi:MAG: SprT-like domain-containing protein [Bacteroidales bacterium]|nr:SprT-like domain-containing protein [Bacteroidales bacterium]
MKPTIPYLQACFREYNDAFFDGELPEVPIVLSRSKSFIGACTYKRRRVFGLGTRLSDFKLRFSTRMDLPEEEVQDTVIHEMIHYYILSKGIRDTSTHGRVFRAMMQEINTRYGRHITISHRPTPQQREEVRDKRPKRHIVAIITLKDGRSGIKVIPPTRHSLTAFLRGLRRSGQAREAGYYLTDDPFFNAWPSSSALKIYFADMEAVRAHLTAATPLSGNKNSGTL